MFPRILLLLCLAIVPAFGEDWPRFLGPRGDNTSLETGLVDTLPEKGLPLVWEKAVGTGYGAPSVLGDKLVLHHRVGDEEIVEALDASTGKSLWRYAYPSNFTDPFGYNNGPRCTPVLSGNRCYTYGAEGVLLCLDLDNGKLVWRRDTLKEFNVPESFFGVGSSPLLEDGLLFVMVGGQPNSAVVAFDPATGKTVWANGGEKTWTGVPMTRWPGDRVVSWNPADPAFQKQASYCTPVLATINGRRHLLCLTRQGLISLEPKTGTHQFSFWFRSRQDASVNAMTPVVFKDEILLSSAYYKTGSVLLRVNKDGNGVDEVWRGLQLEIHWARPILHDGFIYASSGRNEGDAVFRCVAWADGKMRWERPEGWPNSGHLKPVGDVSPPNVFGRASLIMADGKIFAWGENGLLGIFKPTPEKIEEIARWQVTGMRYPCWAGPVLTGKRLYLRNEERLVCYGLQRLEGEAPAEPVAK